ncbi:phosphatase PAP2 family protein [Kitasatospora sp. NPDC096147]|uniref:phosphatase PAP2 family protein n=1 Tax=Kitasatospora sp. NPDC096147 TaxID=3364093 RepID=UPI003827F772
MYPPISGARAQVVPPNGLPRRSFGGRGRGGRSVGGRPPGGRSPDQRTPEGRAALRRRRQLLTCTAASLGSATLLAVLVLLVLGGWGPLRHLDRSWITALHEYAVDHPMWSASMQTLADIGSTVTMRGLLTLAALWLWAIGARTLGGWAASLILTGWLTSALGKELTGRERPAFRDPVASADGFALPSGHALASAITCGALVILVWPRADRTGRIAACTVAGLSVLTIGWTRIALGLHWPSDVLAGWLAAVLVIGGVTLAIELWRPGALSRDVRRVGWRTRPRVQRVLAAPAPASDAPLPAPPPLATSADSPHRPPAPDPGRTPGPASDPRTGTGPHS